MQNIIVINTSSRIISIIEIALYAIIGILIYAFILYKAKILMPIINELKKGR